ncbi:efflux RND transporter permease subunit [Candidatus Sumerlaeota bacterium]|nr:efflux RND transporter permease subunit [Candidatus Sumerlaeota bacterium]
MIISDFSIKHVTTVFALLVVLIVMGLISYMKLPRESNPDIEIPWIFVVTAYEGASPEDVENLITRPIERKLKSLTDVKEMKSSSTEGISHIQLEFEPDIEVDNAIQKVREKVDQAKGDLPSDLLDDPEVIEFSLTNEFPVMFVFVTGDVGLVRLKKIAEDIQDEIESISGVLEAKLSGGLEREIRVEFDLERIGMYGLTLPEILSAIRSNNLNTPSGSIDIGDAKYSLKVPGEFTTPDEINNIVVAVRDGRPIYLTDIATAVDTFQDRTSFARLDRTEAVSLKVTKRAGENLLQIADKIKEIGDAWEQKLPEGIDIIYTNDSSKDIHNMVSDLENNILSGLLLVLVVIFVSLGFRNAILVSLAIPFSMLLTFVTLDAMGITLNMVVLFSLVLALGMLVDNAIVIVENIYRHRSEGKPLKQAASEATSEVAWPVITSTATTVAAFGPLLFWPGIMGEFMMYLPLTVIIALLASLFVALVITPALGSLLVRVSVKHRAIGMAGAVDDLRSTPQFGPIVRAYRGILRRTLNSSGAALLVIFFFGLLVYMIFLQVQLGNGTEMFPDTEPQRIMVSIDAPEGSNIYQTDQLTRIAEEQIERYGNIRTITTTVGASNSGNAPNKAQIVVDMVDRELRADSGPGGKIYFRDSNQTLAEIRKDVQSAIVGATVKVDKEEMGPPTGADVNVEISGDDFDALAAIADQLMRAIKDVPGLVDLEDDYERGLPEFRVEVDKERAALLGLDASQIGAWVKAAVNGMVVGDYREGEDEYDIVARLPEERRSNIEQIASMRIPDYEGNATPLTSVARIVTSSGLGAIKHIDQKRVVTVSANAADGYNANQLLAHVQEIAKTINLPSGYQFSYTGQNEDQEESQEFLTQAFLIALFLIALILITQFNSITTPLIIMVSVILSLLGVYFGLILLDKPFGVIMTGMGVISLAGVVVNNAIVLIDYIEQLRAKGFELREAILRAGCARFRPVMLTAITTILGLLPMAIGVSFDFRKWEWILDSESSQWWGAMATAVIFGLTVATILTLVVVPSLYFLLDWLFAPLVRAWKRVTTTDEQSFGSAASQDEAPVK